MNWHDYLRQVRAQKLSEIPLLKSGKVRSFIMADGVQRETTGDNIEKLKADVAEIEQILTDAGELLDA